MDTLDTRETLQTQTDRSLQLRWGVFLRLEKPSLVTLAVSFRKKNIIIQAIISVGTLLSSEMVCCTEAVGVLPSHFNSIHFLAVFTICDHGTHGSDFSTGCYVSWDCSSFVMLIIFGLLHWET